MSRRFLVAATPFAMVLVAGLLGVGAAAAQVAGGSVSGIVTDQQGAALPGVTVTASAAPVSKAVVTAADGAYRVVDLAPGAYSVTCELPGFARLVRDNVAVREGLNLTLDLTMKVGEISETVDVRGDSPLLESKTAANGINISGDLQRALPLSGLRTWADALTLVPGVTTENAWRRLPTSSQPRSQPSSLTRKRFFSGATRLITIFRRALTASA